MHQGAKALLSCMNFLRFPSHRVDHLAPKFASPQRSRALRDLRCERYAKMAPESYVLAKGDGEKLDGIKAITLTISL